MTTTTFKKATAKEKKAFARRFSFDRWMELCGNGKFEAAFEAGDLETCKLIIEGLIE